MQIVTFICICGADKPSDCKYYDGAVGYEALICKRCGRMYDHLGQHQADKFSCQHVGITEEQAAKYSTEALVEERKVLITALELLSDAATHSDIAFHVANVNAKLVLKTKR